MLNLLKPASILLLCLGSATGLCQPPVSAEQQALAVNTAPSSAALATGTSAETSAQPGTVASVITNTESTDKLLAGLSLVGQGNMRWMWFDLYLAQFYSQDGRYHPQRYPQALAINYLRKIDKRLLIKTTQKEWRRLEIDWQQQWLNQLANIWPSVESGDQLVLLVDSQAFSHFYLNGQALGSIKDPSFAAAFLAIWLSPHSRAPTLRQQLIGQQSQ